MALSRITTHIPGLDQILGGGLIKAGVYLVRGEPGAGKTIFANQLCFGHVAAGGKAGYVTLLAESHGRLLEHIEQFSFYRAEALPGDIYYVSAFNALKDKGLSGVTALVSTEMRSRKIDLLVMDGFVTAAESAGSIQDLKLFVSELQVYSALMGCTILMLNSVSAEHQISPEQTMVDGIFRLRNDLAGSRRMRSLEVVKFRGSAVIGGLHAMQICDDGVFVYPRLEAACTSEVTHAAKGAALATGVVGLDGLSHSSGYPVGSVTAAAGAPGSGKTLLGLHFVGQASAEEPALVFSFYESPALLVEIAAGFGIDLQRLLDEHALEILWQPCGALQLDELGYRLLRAVERTRCQRLFIDGLGGFLSAPSFPERGTTFLATLFNELRRQSVTTLATVESDDPQGFGVPVANHGISAMADNVIRLRIEEKNGLMRRLVSIGKVRGSRIELSLRELRLSASGLDVVPAGSRFEVGGEG